MSNNLLEVKNLKKSFGGLQAVNIKELIFKKNQLTSIIGPNGAGKTTFFDLISGFQTADSGDIFLKGCLLYTSPSPRDQRGSRMPSSA